MVNKEQFRSTQLLQQAQDMGLLGSDWTLECDNCHAIYPGDYGVCPKCLVENLFCDIKIDFEI